MASRLRRDCLLFLVVACIGCLLPITARAQPGTLDLAWNPAAPNAPVYALGAQSDGRLIIEGDFTQVGSTARQKLARLNSDGSVDESFDIGSGPNYSWWYPFPPLLVQRDDKVVLGGGFTQVNGVSRLGLARLLTTGAVDTEFYQHDSLGNPVFDGVSKLASAGDGSGRFVAEGSSAGVAKVARFLPDGTLDTTYDPATDPYPFAWLQSGGRKLILVSDIAGRRIKRLNADGSPDASFISIPLGGGDGNPVNSSNVTAIAVQPNDKIVVATLVGRPFSDHGHVFRLLADGGWDNSFVPASSDVDIFSIAVLQDGGVVIAGLFSTVNGVARSRVARLAGDLPGKPQITTQPANERALEGGHADFSVQVSSLEAPSFQWRFNGTDIPMGTNQVLQLSNVQLDQAGSYSVVVRNSAGITESVPVTLTVVPTKCPVPSFGVPLPLNLGPGPPAYNAADLNGDRAVADFNGDGKPDFAVFDSMRSNVLMRLSNGDGSFQAPIPTRLVDQLADVLAARDFDGDGQADLVVVSGWTLNPIGISVYPGNGDGTFRLPVRTSADTGTWAPVSVAAGDFNGDGKLDLAVNQHNVTDLGSVSIFLGRGDGSFNSGVRLPSGAPPAFAFHGFGAVGPEGRNSIMTGDFNGDGKVDLVFVNPGRNGIPQIDFGVSGTISVLLGSGAGGFGEPIMTTSAVFPYSAVLGDFDRDGRLDVVVAGFGKPNGGAPPSPISGVYVLSGNGDGTFRAPVEYSISGSPAGIAAGDFNGDGQPDLAVAGATNMSVLLGIGDGAFEPPGSFAVGGSLAAVANFNGDSQPDILAADALLLNTCSTNNVAQLSVTVGTTVLKLSWPMDFNRHLLESQTDAGSTNWQTVVETVTAVNGMFEVTVPHDQGQRYFRLRKL